MPSPALAPPRASPLPALLLALLLALARGAGPNAAPRTGAPVVVGGGGSGARGAAQPAAPAAPRPGASPAAPANGGAGEAPARPALAGPVFEGGVGDGARNLHGGDGAEGDARQGQQGCPAADQCSFVERFASKSDRWIAADGYANGNPFEAWWSKNKAVIDLGAKKLRLVVDKVPGFGKQYVGGQLQSTKWYGYGCYEVRMKPVNQEGLISTFFTYTGKWDAAPGASKKHNEVDIEFVYKKSAGGLMMQANYFTNGKGGNEHYVKLPFKAEQAFHNYAFRWAPNKIEWFVDGKKVYTAFKNIPKASNGNHKIMANFWPVSRVAAGWGGWYNFQGPRAVLYDAIRFTKGANCAIVNKF